MLDTYDKINISYLIIQIVIEDHDNYYVIIQYV